MGEADYIKEILHEIGEVKFWKVAMKPGRPLAFGKIGAAFFFGLPGNPVSVMVTFYQFVRPALMKLMGGTADDFVTVKARAANPLKKRPGRMEFQRGYLATAADGELEVSTDKDQGSGILSSMSRAKLLYRAAYRARSGATRRVGCGTTLSRGRISTANSPRCGYTSTAIPS